MEISGKVVKQLRLSKSWSQQHLADVCDVSLRTIQRVERFGAGAPETVMALAVAFEVQQSELAVSNETSLARFAPQTDKGAMLLILATSLLGATVGTLLTLWLVT